MISSSLAPTPGLSVTNAFGRSPHMGCGTGTTAHSSTAGCLTIACPTSIVRAAIRDLRRGRRAWQDLGAPYETAWCRVRIAEALAAIGDHVSATMEREAALSAFQRLGALPDAERATSMLDELASA